MALLTQRQAFVVETVTRTYTPIGATETWADSGPLSGWLDMMNGTDQPTGSLNAAWVEESTHVLITDGMPTTVVTDADKVRDAYGRQYYVTYVDDVTGVGDHLEVYLRYAG